MSYRTIWDVLDSYVLSHDLRPDTVRYYRRTVSVFCRWHGGTIAREDFTVERCNRFLLAKQQAGKSWSYRKSLRSGLRALLNHVGISGKLRTVRSEPLEPECWMAAEVQRLIDAAPNQLWRDRIEAAYLTGLSQVDLEMIERRHVVRGVLTWKRSKTGTVVVVRLPRSMIARLPPTGPCFPRRTSREWFRRQFKKIVVRAGLSGTFKKLRKSSGTSVEARFPGCGHIHLGNTRKVFETHYLSRKSIKPLSPAPLPRKRKTG